ncbi:hypothetical protein BDN72DRAFT_833692 [Pluteus cervinus]|uniref:Uncharacterized protein n=1 Tax=Pluteus cervinus TaxID=181527 RepID=A0ACD3B8B5_9AGAR|nr:hypothetical protein BDN72DRAFT_833692 [Pluteus cervinus]
MDEVSRHTLTVAIKPPTSMVLDTPKDIQSGSTKPSRALLRFHERQCKAAQLLPVEYFWQDKAAWLEAQGYKLRPRYQPGWEPDIPMVDAYVMNENFVPMARASIVDAIRMKDGKRVLLKRLYRSKNLHEIEISQLLGTGPLASDPRNHCALVDDILSPSDEPDLKFMVFPFLQQLTAIPFDSFGEIVDFLQQVFTGLQFMHHHHVAHRDIGQPNIMMEGTELFPDGWHQEFGHLLPDGQRQTTVFTRTQRPPKYYLIDFGLSRRYDPSDPNPLEEPIYGGDRTVPEFDTDEEVFNPFRTDIYYLGNMIRKYIIEGKNSEFTGYFGTGFLRSLVKDMTRTKPEKRPTIDQVVRRFNKICKKLSTWKLRSRPIPRTGNIRKGLHNHMEHWKRRRDFVKRGVPPIPSRQLQSTTEVLPRP